MPVPPISPLLDQLRNGVLLCDEDGSVVYANPAAQALLGRDADWLSAHPVDTWLQHEDGLLWRGGDMPEQRRLHFLDSGGRRLSTSAVVGPLPVGAGLGCFVCFRDVDPSAQELAGLRTMAGGMARQLGQQLGTLVDAASEALLANPPEALAARLREVLAAAQDAAGLQRQLAALSGRGGRMEPHSLAGLLQEAAPMWRSLLGVRTALRLGPPAGQDTIEADPGTLRLALLTLAEWQAAQRPQPAHVLVEIQGPVEGDPSVRLRITDDGPGLSQRRQARLFDPYSEEEGLGLALVAGVLERHHGRVLVDSSPGHGTVFHIAFPAALEQAPPARPEQPRGHETVFVVEDDPPTLEMMTETLRGHGFRVLAAANGVEASVLIRRHHDDFDILLSDVLLPGRSGLELAAELRAIRPELPILLVSGYPPDLLGSRLRADLPLLAKPFAPSELFRRLRELLDARGARSPG